MQTKLNLISVLLILVLISCRLSEKDSVDDILRLNEELEVTPAKSEIKEIESPGVMPSDHPLLLMKFDPDKNGWKEYYQYLKTELQKEREKHYYANLEWINISSIIKAKDFNDAPVDIIKELWKLMSERSFINEPEVALILINKQNYTGNEIQTAKMAQYIININKKFFEGNSEGWKQTYESNYKSYQKLKVLTCDRWGIPLVKDNEI